MKGLVGKRRKERLEKEFEEIMIDDKEECSDKWQKKNVGTE